VRPGDVITALDGQTVRSSQDLVSKLAQLQPGAEVDLAGRRRDEAYRLKLPVTERPTRLAQADVQGQPR